MFSFYLLPVVFHRDDFFRQQFDVFTTIRAELKRAALSVNSALASCSAERLKSASVKSVLNARGGIRTHVGLRQRILSPPPCLRLFLAAYLDLARVPSQTQC